MSGLGRSSEPLEVGFCGYFPCRRFAFSSSIQRSGSALIRFDGRDVDGSFDGFLMPKELLLNEG
jgi:hypothetical protein